MSTQGVEAKTVAVREVSATPGSKYLRCCDREVHYMERGRPDAPTVMMVHGLARTGRDFDELAAALSDTYRVICPDMIGRGLSQWSPKPEEEYRFDFYARLVAVLADQLSIVSMRWVGTSMGGLIGIWGGGASALKGRISHLVVNDVSPIVAPSEALERIVSYLSKPPEFDTVTEFEGYLRLVYKPYGQQSDLFWRTMAETSARRLPNGKITNHYHPEIVKQFSADPDLVRLWDAYKSLSMPTLVFRGMESDVMPREAAQAMTECGPRARLIEIPGCGHAPTLNTPEQIDLVRRLFAQPST